MSIIRSSAGAGVSSFDPATAELRPSPLRAPRCARQENSRKWKVEKTSPAPLLAPGFWLLAPSARPRRGFSLGELLVVIGIIAVLISLLLPALQKARQSATQLKCLSNMRQVAQVMTMYADDNKGFYPGVKCISTGSNGRYNA